MVCRGLPAAGEQSPARGCPGRRLSTRRRRRSYNGRARSRVAESFVDLRQTKPIQIPESGPDERNEVRSVHDSLVPGGRFGPHALRVVEAGQDVKAVRDFGVFSEWLYQPACRLQRRRERTPDTRARTAALRGRTRFETRVPSARISPRGSPEVPDCLPRPRRPPTSEGPTGFLTLERRLPATARPVVPVASSAT